MNEESEDSTIEDRYRRAKKLKVSGNLDEASLVFSAILQADGGSNDWCLKAVKQLIKIDLLKVRTYLCFS